MSEKEKDVLTRNIIAGLPGAEESFSLEQFQASLDTYIGISEDQLRNNLFYFINEITDLTNQDGVQMAIHSYDPPRSILGLPHILSTAEYVRKLFAVVPNEANGKCY